MFYLNDQTLIINENDFAEKLESLTNLEMRNVFEGLLLKLKEDYKNQAEIICENTQYQVTENYESLLFDVIHELKVNIEDCDKLIEYIVNTKRVNRQQLQYDVKNIKKRIFNINNLINNNL